MAQKNRLMPKARAQRDEKDSPLTSTACDHCCHLQNIHNAVTLDIHHPKVAQANLGKNRSSDHTISNGQVPNLSGESTAEDTSKKLDAHRAGFELSPRRQFHLPVGCVSTRKLYFFGDPHWIYRLPW